MPKRTSPREEERPVAARISDGMVRVTLQDGRVIATPTQQQNVELSYAGVHWPDLDEDLSVQGMLQGRRPPQSRQAEAAAG